MTYRLKCHMSPLMRSTSIDEHVGVELYNIMIRDTCARAARCALDRKGRRRSLVRLPAARWNF